ncbi:MAG: aspartate-semialdehyde dehydrogenase, partial [Acidobacteriota bacterium]
MKATHPARKIPVGILGATGTVGQRFITLLHNHPWFHVETVAASKGSAGKTYGEAVHWVQTGPLPEAIARLEVKTCTPPVACPLIFSALDARVAGGLELEHAKAG